MTLTPTRQNILIAALIAAAVLVLLLIAKLIRKMKAPVNPVKGKITSKFGIRTAPTAGASTNHNGVDVGVPVGTSVVAPWDGAVADTYTNDKGGLQLILKHSNGYRTGYAHLSEVSVKKGESVKAGQQVCLSGNTGITSGPHLHFTLTDPKGNKVNPETMFNFA